MAMSTTHVHFKKHKFVFRNKIGVTFEGKPEEVQKVIALNDNYFGISRGSFSVDKEGIARASFREMHGLYVVEISENKFIMSGSMASESDQITFNGRIILHHWDGDAQNVMMFNKFQTEKSEEIIEKIEPGSYILARGCFCVETYYGSFKRDKVFLAGHLVHISFTFREFLKKYKPLTFKYTGKDFNIAEAYK